MRRQRILIDASGAPKGSGGMQLYARELLLGWVESHANDGIVIFGPRWLKEELATGGSRFPFLVWPNKRAVFRIFGQIILVPLIFLFLQCTRLLALNAVASPVIPSKYITVVNLDWRHLKNPGEFSSAQNFYRRLWVISSRRANNVIAISGKTLRESERVLERHDVTEISLGSNHPARWRHKVMPTSGGPLSIVTFGHHSNKRPWLVISAMLAATKLWPPLVDARLTVLGLSTSNLSNDQRVTLAKFGSQIALPGFVEESEYQRIISGASLLILASSDEGFGIPVVEAAYFGIPCLVSDDSGLAEIHGNLVTPAEPEIGPFSESIVQILKSTSARAQLFGSQKTWADVAIATREVVLR
jgi:glycosyltransferase involved in cell wall biosynthesis